MSQSRPRRRQGVLAAVFVLLLGSAFLRFGVEVDMARAFEIAETDEAEAAVAAPDTPSELVAALQRREERVVAREAALADRERALAVAETQIATMMRALQQTEESLSATLAVADKASENDLASLTAVYENMAPAETAALFERMAPQFAAGFLARMQPGPAAGVMANLDPDIAHEVSVVLAGRNARVPRN